ncbi:MAG TPA: protein kinase [Polyangiaceae bacterium]|jgi:serine/threonine protein kinase|nr:protein kinase [Polyangiaceae bacterium]
MAELATDRPETGTGLDGIPLPGEMVGGKFVVERVLGVGGMGVVVAARHMQLGQTVAIKFLRRSAATSPESVNRFLREARASVGLQSAHVVRVMDVGTLDDGLPFMVMEHLNGTDLGQSLEARGVLPVEEAVDCLVQAMDAVAEAHSFGIVHRDLKPSNLFLTARTDGSPLVKVLDFGISKAVDTGGQRVDLTSTSMVLGSPLYMSPEQVRSTKSVDTRTDVWALGVILYELVAGVPPFEAETVTGLCAKIVADPPVPLRSRRPEISTALEGVVNRCLDKEVSRRFRSVADLATALRPFASSEGRLTIDRISRMVGSRPSMPSLQDTGRGGTPVPNSAGRESGARGASGEPSSLSEASAGYAETVASWQTTGTRRNRRIATGASVALALLVGTAAGVFLLRTRHASQGGEPLVAAGMVMTPAAIASPSGPSTASRDAVPAAVGHDAPGAPSAVAVLAPAPVAPPDSVAAPAAAAPSMPAANSAPQPLSAPQPVSASRNARPPTPPARPTASAPKPVAPSAPKPSQEDLLLERK